MKISCLGAWSKILCSNFEYFSHSKSSEFDHSCNKVNVKDILLLLVGFYLYTIRFTLVSGQSICVQPILAHPHTLRTIAFHFAHSRTAHVRFLIILPHPHPHTSPGPQKKNDLHDIHVWS